MCKDVGMTNTTESLIPATLFLATSGRLQGWVVSYPTRIGFQHVKVAGKGSARPSVQELADKGYEVAA